MPTLYCPQCGYNLTGLPEQRCPECGCIFNRAELTAIGGIEHPSLAWPLLILLINSTVFAGLMFLADWVPINRVLLGDSIVFQLVVVFMMGACIVVGLIVSIFAGRRIARRLAMRPPRSRPSAKSALLAIVFALVFFFAQAWVSVIGFILLLFVIPSKGMIK
ncbi:MAG: hypothetical protein ACYTGQ_12710 [Planctomycetota bacterium]|jgi:hypothetical protein